jgi:3,4-dihydroxy 2-butanone 4-phosphate synthase / GTP cyclohydrolase II
MHNYKGLIMDKEWFKLQMRTNNLTQDDIGRLIGKDRSTFSRILNGEIELKPQYVDALSKIFNTSKMDIMHRAGYLSDNDIQGFNNDFNNIEKSIEAIKNGEMLIVTDDYDRENEGDLIMAASLCTPEQMAFIVRHTSGIVCAPLSAQIAKKLQLAPMVAENNAPHSTAFTISVDAKEGTTTGISAAERTITVRALANNNMNADDFVRPGHVFPLVAREGGVLTRSGHTEAAVDLCRLANLPEVGVICEMVNDDGSVMRGDDIVKFAKTHKLRRISIAELIAYRQSKESLVQRMSSFTIPSKFGNLKAFSFSTKFDSLQHLAIIYGNIEKKKKILTRLHRADILDDVFNGASLINSCLEKFAQEGCGVLVYLREGNVGVSDLGFNLKDDGNSKPQESESKRQNIWREIGIGAQILRDLGVNSINLITRTNPRFAALRGYGISIDEVTKIT